MGVGERIREFFTGTFRYTATAVALLVVAVIAVLVDLTSPTHLWWTGTSVTGINDGGIVYYRWHGQQYTKTASSTPPRPTPTTVWFNPSDPYDAVLDEPARWIDVAMVVVPLAGAAGFVVAGQLRKRRRARYVATHRATFGEGLDPDAVRRHLERLRQGPGRS